MQCHAEQPIIREFSARARDVTPCSLRGAVRVLYLAVEGLRGSVDRFDTVISDAERARARRFVDPGDAANFVHRRAFRRFCGSAVLGGGRSLADINFVETPDGRPYLAAAPGVWFSFASCLSGILCAWSSNHNVGVDIEDRVQDLDPAEMAGGYFGDLEARHMMSCQGRCRTEAFLGFWCLKEAALKSIGQGLPFGLDAFAFDLSPAPYVVEAPADHGGPGRFNCHRLDGTDACAALVVHHRSPGVGTNR